MKHSKYILLILCLFLGACSMPRLVVLSDPLSAEEHNDLGVAYEYMGETELALREYELAFRRNKDWDQPLINHGNVHAGMENWEKAEQSYKKALERNPDNPEAMNNLAYVLIMQDRGSEALDLSSRAVEYGPKNPAFLNTMAMALENTGNRHKATEKYLKALDHAPVDSDLYERIKTGLKSLDEQ